MKAKTRTQTRTRVPATALLVTALLSCARAPKEARALCDAFDRYRLAPDATRAPLADALDAVPCTDAEVCDAKKACVASARPTVAAVAIEREVVASLARIDAGTLAATDPEARALPSKLDDASRLLGEGHAALADCEARVAALRLKYGN